jgi:RimJ/RimL family protein N-acetyltransferase
MNRNAFDRPIETPRLVIRRVEERDLDGLMAVNGDDEVTRYLPYASWRSVDDAQAWLVRMNGMQDDGRACQLVTVDRAADRPVGAILLFNFDDANRRAELGYVLGRRDWGRGVMREALDAVLRCAFADLDARRIEAFVDPRNAASHGLLLRLGFRHEGLLRARSVMKEEVVDANVYGLLADDRATR